jgi:hypothetical protein
MQTRYNLMTSSAVYDIVDTQAYPDVLIVNFSQFHYAEPPYILPIDDRMKTKPFIITNAFYGVATYEDIIFNINNVSHISQLYNFTTMSYPTMNDLSIFFQTRGAQ